MKRDIVLKIFIGCVLLIGIAAYYLMDNKEIHTETLCFYKYNIDNAKDQEIVILECDDENVLKYTSYVIENPYNYDEYFDQLDDLTEGKITKTWVDQFTKSKREINKLLYPKKLSKFETDDVETIYIQNVLSYCVVYHYSCDINKSTLKYLCGEIEENYSLPYEWTPKNAILEGAVLNNKSALDRNKTINLLTSNESIYIGSNGFKQVTEDEIKEILYQE